MLKRWPGPCHIRLCILQAIAEAERDNGQPTPHWLSAAIREGVNRAVRESDAENGYEASA